MGLLDAAKGANVLSDSFEDMQKPVHKYDHDSARALQKAKSKPPVMALKLPSLKQHERETSPQTIHEPYISSDLDTGVKHSLKVKKKRKVKRKV
jgi:hypothetical protein